MNLKCEENGGEYIPHPEGVHDAVCVDVIDLGMEDTEWQGLHKMKPKVRIVFETESLTPEGKPMTIGKKFTASLNQKAKLNEFLGKWRGKPLAVGENIDLDKLLGANCRLVVSSIQDNDGKVFSVIDAVTKPTPGKKLVPSGSYDRAAALQRVLDKKARIAAGGGQATARPQAQAAPAAAAPAAKTNAKAQAVTRTTPGTPDDDDVPF